MTASVAADDAHAASTAPAPTLKDSPGGVRLERLRTGSTDEVLYIVPGLEGDPTELTALAAALAGPEAVYAVAPLPEDCDRQPVTTVERMAELIVAAIREIQPAGPYRLGGYSFGALVALEAAQQMHAAGDAVEPLILVEAVFDERYWPRGTWLRALATRTARQLLRIVRMPPRQAVREFRLRGGRLIQRVVRRNVDAADGLPVDAADATPMGVIARSAIGAYRPRFYPGSITLIASSIDRHFGCDTSQLWRGYAQHLEIHRIEGDHLTVVHDPASAAAVANVIDHRLALARPGWSGVRPAPGFERPMILTTMRWFSAARLAYALAESGFAVSACRPRGHVLELVDGLTGDHRLNRLRQLHSLASAIRGAKPDIVLCDDERALVLLRRLHARIHATDPQMAALIARSLGDVAAWPSIKSRTAFAREARALGIAAPDTAVIASADALAQWAAEREPPIVLKTDGSWGGRGVAVIRDKEDLRDAWRTVSNPPRLSRAVKRMVFNFEAGGLASWLRRRRPTVNAQQFVYGREAIATVACVDGVVHALVCLEVVQASEARGPASVVRIINHPTMAEAARRLVGKFGLTGFCGFDFILTEAGEARLLELNPRVTPTCHLLVEGDYLRPRTIALFPAEMVRDAESDTAGIVDVPTRAPALIRRGIDIADRQHRPLTMATRRFVKRFSTSRY